MKDTLNKTKDTLILKMSGGNVECMNSKTPFSVGG